MTTVQLESYLVRLLPGFHKQYAKTADEHDLVQRSVIDLYKKHHELTVTNDKEFTNFFLRFYRTWQFHRRATVARCLTYGNHLHEFMSYSGQYADEAQEISDSLDNPWESDKAQALEYIELIGQPWIRKVFYLYYIEGYTIIEVANLYEVPHDRVEKALKHGLEHIKEWITEGTKNKPDPS